MHYQSCLWLFVVLKNIWQSKDQREKVIKVGVIFEVYVDKQYFSRTRLYSRTIVLLCVHVTKKHVNESHFCILSFDPERRHVQLNVFSF